MTETHLDIAAAVTSSFQAMESEVMELRGEIVQIRREGAAVADEREVRQHETDQLREALDHERAIRAAESEERRALLDELAEERGARAAANELETQLRELHDVRSAELSAHTAVEADRRELADRVVALERLLREQELLLRRARRWSPRHHAGRLLHRSATVRRFRTGR